MNEANKSIAKSISSGQYFIDARRWYFEKFVGLHVERTFLLIMSGLLIFAAGIAFMYASNISSYVNQVSFLSYNDNMESEYSHIKALSTNISPQLAIEKQLIKDYIETRESFKLSDQAEKEIYIKNHSTPEEYNKYLNHISIDNENNPILVYGNKFVSTINANSIEIKKNNNSNIKIALVNYDQTIEVKGQTFRKSGKAEISYSLSNIEELVEQKNKIIDFKVTKYLAKTFN